MKDTEKKGKNCQISKGDDSKKDFLKQFQTQTEILN